MAGRSLERKLGPIIRPTKLDYEINFWIDPALPLLSAGITYMPVVSPYKDVVFHSCAPQKYRHSYIDASKIFCYIIIFRFYIYSAREQENGKTINDARKNS